MTRDLVEPRHRLGVVVQHVGPRCDHRVQRGGTALEIGDQELDAAARRFAPDRPHRGREGGGAAVGQVVPVDRGDHDVLEPEPVLR